jgi:hypothetical protein
MSDVATTEMSLNRRRIAYIEAKALGVVLNLTPRFLWFCDLGLPGIPRPLRPNATMPRIPSAIRQVPLTL